MSDSWLVTSYHFRLHAFLEIAESERDRLAQAFPKKDFKVYRVKSHVQPSRSKQIIEELQADVRKAYRVAADNGTEVERLQAENARLRRELDLALKCADRSTSMLGPRDPKLTEA